MPFEIRQLIDATTGQSFTAQVFVGTGTPIQVPPLQGSDLALVAPVALLAGIDTLIGAITVSANASAPDVFMRASIRCSALALSGCDKIRLRLKQDGVQLDASDAIDSVMGLDFVGGLNAHAQTTLCARLLAPDALPHDYEVWLEASGGDGEFSEGTLEVDNTPP